MANFFVFLLFVGIGSIFGPVGFVIGAITGAIAWAGSASKNKTANSQVQPAKAATPALTGSERASNVAFTSLAAPIHVAQPPSGPRPEHLKEYNTIISQIFANFLSRLPKNDFSKINTVIALIKSDEWVLDKFASLDVLANELQLMQKERQESAMLFLLRSNVLVERAMKLPSPMRTRLATHIDTLVKCMSETDPKECTDLFDTFRQQLQKGHPASDSRFDTETFIIRNGDTAAIKMMQRIRKLSPRYRYILKSGATGTTFLKTALGVSAGVIAAEAVRAAITDSQKEILFQKMDQNIEKAGGIDNLPPKYTELDAMSSAESQDQSGFDSAENTSYTSSDTLANGDEALLGSPVETYSEEWDLTPDPQESESLIENGSAGDLQECASDTGNVAAYESDSANDYISDD